MHAECIKSTAPTQLLLRLRLLAPTPADCRVTGDSDPIRGAVRPHAQYPVIDRRVVDLLDSSYTLPHGVKSVKPNLVYVFQSVVMNIEFPNSRCDFSGGTREISTRGSGIPCCIRRRTAGELTPLFDRDNGRGFECCY